MPGQFPSCRIGLTATSGVCGHWEKVAVRSRSSSGLQLLILTVVCSEFSLVRKRRVRSLSGKKVRGRHVARNRDVHPAKGNWAVQEPITGPRATVPLRGALHGASHCFVPGCPPLPGFMALWGCSKSTGSSNDSSSVTDRNTVSL